MKKVLRRSILSMLRSAKIPPMHGDQPKTILAIRACCLRQARLLEHPRAVVHDRVDAGELLGHATPIPTNTMRTSHLFVRIALKPMTWPFFSSSVMCST